MNRVIARKLAVNIYGSKVLPKTFCTGATVETSSSFCGKPSYEHEGKPSFTNGANQHDIAIIGGGMVGLALACSLASMPLTKHLSVAIVDSNPALGNINCIRKEDPPDPRECKSSPEKWEILVPKARSTTVQFDPKIFNSLHNYFTDIGAWEFVQQHRHAYFDKMQVWDYTGLGYTRYDARDADRDVLGCVVENRVLHSSLMSGIQNKDFQKTFYFSKLASMNLSPSTSSVNVGNTSTSTDLAKLELSDGNSLYAKLVVGSDGGKSHVRRLAGFKTTGWNYPQNAIICTVEHSVENTCAWQRFLPSGPIALLPLGDKFSNIVWTMSPKEASELRSNDDDNFVKALNHALDYGYGPHPQSSSLGDMFSWFRADMKSSTSEGFEVPPKAVKLVGEKMVFPLSLMHANNYALKRAVLVGDAAHTVHPLAGQGVNLGFGDALTLSKVIADGVALGTDIGELSLLKKYEAERKPANVAMMAILDGFQKAYSVDFGPLNVLRAAAFHGVNYISPLKRNIISFASGEQRLPFFA